MCFPVEKYHFKLKSECFECEKTRWEFLEKTNFQCLNPFITHTKPGKKKKKQNKNFLCHVRFNRKTKNKKVTVTKVVANV